MQVNSSKSLVSGSVQITKEYKYPAELPPLRIEILTDDFGMPLNEKVALKMAWRLIKPQVGRLGRETFYEFLTENHNCIDYFRDKMSGKLHLDKLHAHARRMYETIGYIIEHGLDNHQELVRQVTRQIDFHRLRGVPAAYVDQLLDVIMEKVILAISDHYSLSVKRGFEHMREQMRVIRKIYFKRNRHEAIREFKRKFGSFLKSNQSVS